MVALIGITNYFTWSYTTDHEKFRCEAAMKAALEEKIDEHAKELKGFKDRQAIELVKAEEDERARGKDRLRATERRHQLELERAKTTPPPPSCDLPPARHRLLNDAIEDANRAAQGATQPAPGEAPGRVSALAEGWAWP